MSSSKGECRFCHKIFSGRGIGKHLLACRSKKEKDETLNGRKNQGYIYHLKMSAWGLYWLHIEMEGTSTLLDIGGCPRIAVGQKKNNSRMNKTLSKIIAEKQFKY